MDNIVKEIIVGDKKLKIYQDEMPESPRTWDNLGKMICFHKRYTLGDKHEYKHDDYNSWEEMKKAIEKAEDALVMLPLRLYDHSGITMSTSNEYPYNDRWDAGIVGFIIATREQIKKCFEVKRITNAILEKVVNILQGEVETYDQYLRGDIYRFEVVKVDTCDKGCEHEEFVDSCGGFFGDDYKTNGMTDHLEKEMAEALLAD
jgi:hypothetical protein